MLGRVLLNSLFFMRSKYFWGTCVCVVFLLPTTTNASNDPEAWVEEVNDAVIKYDEGSFGEAVELFSKAAKFPSKKWTDTERGFLLYNLGNAFYKTENPASAFAAYLESRKYIPSDANLRSNLERIKKLVKDDVELALPSNRYSVYLPFLAHLSFSSMAIIFGGVAAILALLSLLVRAPDLKGVGRMFMSGWALWVIIGGGVLYASSSGVYNYAVVQATSVSVMSSPGAAGIELFKLQSATPVRVTGESGPYLKVFVDHKNEEAVASGWLKKSDLIYFF